MAWLPNTLKDNGSRLRTLALTAGFLSFFYHVVLAIFVNYVPLDGAGLGLVLWIYSWTACAITYFGVLGLVAKRPLLIQALSYCLFLDSFISTFCRFIILEYVVHHPYQDHCNDLFESLLSLQAGEEALDSKTLRRSTRLYTRCHMLLSAKHITFFTVLLAVTAVEAWLANAVRRYGKSLPRPEFDFAAVSKDKWDDDLEKDSSMLKERMIAT